VRIAHGANAAEIEWLGLRLFRKRPAQEAGQQGGVELGRRSRLGLSPQSEVTKPLKPISSRRILTSVSELPQACVPLTLL
jgi:hypothetical protein